MREVEVKALLTEQQYNELREFLPQHYQETEHDTITTHRFRPHDVRVRYSDKIAELVYKSDDPTTHNREEITIQLKGLEDARNALLLLENLGFKADPSWIKRKQEFLMPFGGETFTLSLQFIENFAYILEAEIMDGDEAHIPKLKEALRSLGCDPIEPEEFKARIRSYIAANAR